MALPLTITLYDHAKHKALAEYTRGRIPWKFFKDGFRLARRIDRAGALTQTTHQELAALLADLTGVTASQVLTGMWPIEMTTALAQIVRRARDLSQQPAPGDTEPAGDPDGSPDWIHDLELQLVRSFGWSLHDIDETDTESLLSFVSQLMQPAPAPKPRRVFCDQVTWL